MIDYGISSQFLTPYRDIRYHLKEMSQMADARSINYKELWNLRHSSLCNIIERAFGVIKQQFQVLKVGSQYQLEIQI